MNRAAFYAALRKRDSGIFGTSLSQSQVDGLERLLSAVSASQITYAAYILATAYHETGATMQPIREAFGKTDEDTINRLDRAWKAGKLGQVRAPYWRKDDTGRAWFGRGYVQLTHRDNYAKAAAITGVDLVGDPSRAMNPEVAAKILVEGSRIGMFTGKRLGDYLPGDYVGARKVINGTDKAQMIARYAKAFERALQEADFAPVEPRIRNVALTVPGQADTPPTAKKPAPAAVPAAIGVALTGAFAAFAAYWEQIKAYFGG